MGKVNIDNLSIEIEKILRNYGDLVFQATEKGLTAGEKVLIRNLKRESPKDSGEYAKSWKGKGRKYKLKRYVGNTKMVKGKKREIPLSNILEYSTKSKYYGLIKTTYLESTEEIAQAIIDEIKKE